VGLGRRARRPLGEQQPTVGDGLPHVAVLAWVHHVVPGGDHRDRAAGALGGQHALVGAPVDAAGQAGHHVHIGGGEIVAQLPRRIATGRRRVAGADDAHAPPCEQAEIATGEQHRWGQRIVEQQRRVLRAAVGHDLDAELAAPLPHLPWRALGRAARPHRPHPLHGECRGDRAAGRCLAAHHRPRLAR
jgi:hypothetical protein